MRYARPETYRSPVEQVEGPVRPFDFTTCEPSLVEYVEKVWLTPSYLDDLRDAFRRFVGEDYRGSLLDVGCGMGHLHRLLGIDPGRYVGVDMNALFVRAGVGRYPGIRAGLGAADRLPFRDDAFDCVLCSDVLIHLQDMGVALKELISVSNGNVLLRLRSGNGTFQGSKTVYDRKQERLFNRVQISGVWYYIYYNVLAPEDLHELLRDAGVTRYECVDLLPAHADRLGVTKVFFDARQAK